MFGGHPDTWRQLFLSKNLQSLNLDLHQVFKLPGFPGPPLQTWSAESAESAGPVGPVAGDLAIKPYRP